ncbi:DNA repair protein RecN [Corynebacterium terpenotabidum]|uniref:DNA repair protein RecN n=1 Tax=Corynebacterium terpenotabidum Y-11 TaxID=1200352 RepID=S4XG99_9CORY|nr:DNA repair protein RecN [Corynebacterium terpenotabidum]AGP30680.1 DNA repair protein [Corynebacterium terpenotabidum Y-11]
MLTELQIRNLGVIEEATAEFSSGFTVVTGETGAGKTMVVTGLKLLSGARADAQRVRGGTDKASVDGIFTIGDGTDPASGKLVHMVEEIGGYLEDGDVVVSRSVSSSGRSRAHLAGRTVAAAVLSGFTGRMLTIHGQSDQLQLTDPVKQLRSLDAFAGLDDSRREYRRLRRQWAGLAKDLNNRTVKRRELALEAETLRHAVAQIDELDPQPGEDEDLKARISRLQDADDLRTAVAAALTAIDGGDPDRAEESATDALGLAASTLAVAPGGDARVQELGRRLTSLVGELTDISGELGALLSEAPDPESLEDLLYRQQQLRELRTFAVDVDGALAWRDEARQRLGAIDVSDDVLEELRSQVADAAEAMLVAARALAAARTEASGRFAEAVTAEIRGLQMTAGFEVGVLTRGGEGQQPGRDAVVTDCGPDGITDVEFRLVQGGKAHPLGATASGGELSRVMLALEVILAGRGRTMVFDEVDSGVGGRAAVEIGRRLARLAVHNQVIVVTHLPQVAAFADAHVHVAKSATDAAVRSSVRTLTEDERVEELARMLAGLESDTGRAHAEELLATAQSAKNEL